MKVGMNGDVDGASPLFRAFASVAPIEIPADELIFIADFRRHDGIETMSGADDDARSH